MWGSDASNVWATGAGGTLLQRSGSSWTAQLSGTTSGLNGVWGSDPSSLWIVGENGAILTGDGTSWTAQNSGASVILLGV